MEAIPKSQVIIITEENHCISKVCISRIHCIRCINFFINISETNKCQMQKFNSWNLPRLQLRFVKIYTISLIVHIIIMYNQGIQYLC